MAAVRAPAPVEPIKPEGADLAPAATACAIPITQAVYVLPDTPGTREDFEWLQTEVKAAGGDASVFSADHVDAWSDDALVEEFRRSRQESYASLALDVEKALKRPASAKASTRHAILPFTYLAVSSLLVLILLRLAHGSATATFGPAASATLLRHRTAWEAWHMGIGPFRCHGERHRHRERNRCHHLKHSGVSHLDCRGRSGDILARADVCQSETGGR